MYEHLNTSKLMKAEKHGFRLVSPSPWPFLVSVSLLQLALYSVLIFHGFEFSSFMLCMLFLFFFFMIGMWFSDVVIESSYQGFHNTMVEGNLSSGMVLFLLSETMFFFGFFWCFFYMSVSSSAWTGNTWPYNDFEVLNPLGLPLFNTIILLSSGIVVTYGHNCLIKGDNSAGVTFGLFVCIVLGMEFTICQLMEYSMAPFSMNDGMYSSVFYVATGFHGIHVIIGTVCLICCLLSHISVNLNPESHMGFEFSLWYWHSVDVIRLLLYLCFYYWGYTHLNTKL